MVKMEEMSHIVAGILSDDDPKAKQLVSQISQMLLEADLTVQLVNAVLQSVWYKVLETGKLGAAPEQQLSELSEKVAEMIADRLARSI